MRRTSQALSLFFFALALTSGDSLLASIRLPTLISDHAVLQNSNKTALWGTADPGEKIIASIGGINGETTAGPDGKWRLELNLTRVGAGPFDLVISGKNRLTVRDVVVGQVWLASGQSNMSFELQSSIDSAKEIVASGNPFLREFAVKRSTSHEPLVDVEGKWLVATPATTAHFSAVGYYFAKTLQKNLATPVGVIHSSWPGTAIETWISQDSLNTIPDLQAGGEKYRRFIESYPMGRQKYIKAFHAWEAQFKRALPLPADISSFVGEDVSISDWKKITLPSRFADVGLPDAGAIWLRRKIFLTPEIIANHSAIQLGSIPGFDTVYWNGIKCGSTTPEAGSVTDARSYYINYPAAKPGEGVLTVRVAVPTSGAALTTPLKWGNVSLDGEWLAKVEIELPPLDATAAAAPTPPPRAPSQSSWPATLYNAMIAPLTPCTIKGAIWYQGEANVNRAFQYRISLPLMIQDWRARWGIGDFPFYICQLPNFQDKTSSPVENAWSELRDAQTQSLSLPQTGQAILLDLGESRDIHPRNKKDVGERLAALALAKTYGKAIPFSGPVYESQKIEGDKIRLSFSNINSSLVAQPLPGQYIVNSLQNQTQPLVCPSPTSELQGFAICGQDRKWLWADAKIDGDNQVIVWSSKIPEPVAVRYAWSANPTCNLSDHSGFPAPPFRTDDFPSTTQAIKWGSEIPNF